MALSAELLSDLQADLGIKSDERVFTDTELERNYTRAKEDYNTAVVISLRQLYAQSWRLYNYSTGNTSESRVQVRQSVKEALLYWESKTGLLATGEILLGIDQTEE